MVVGAAGDERAAARQEALGQCLGVVGDPLGVRRRTAGWRASASATALAAITCDSGPPSTIGQPRSTASEYSELVSTRPPRGPRSDLCVVVVVMWACGIGSSSPVKTLPATRPGEVGHVDHQGRADLVGDLAHLGEVDPARVRRVAGDQDQRLELARHLARPGRSRAAASRGRCRSCAGGTSCPRCSAGSRG